MQQHYLPMGTTAVLSMALLFFALYCQERQISDGNATGGAGLDFLMEFDAFPSLGSSRSHLQPWRFGPQYTIVRQMRKAETIEGGNNDGICC